jgi:hypothetical protein
VAVLDIVEVNYGSCFLDILRLKCELRGKELLGFDNADAYICVWALGALYKRHFSITSSSRFTSSDRSNAALDVTDPCKSASEYPPI